MAINREKRREYQKKYNEEHKEQVTACTIRCHKANPQARKEAQRRYYLKNQEKLKEYQRNYYKTKKEEENQ